MASLDTFGAKSQLRVADASYDIYKIDALDGCPRAPYGLKILSEPAQVRGGANIAGDLNPAGRYRSALAASKSFGSAP